MYRWIPIGGAGPLHGVRRGKGGESSQKAFVVRAATALRLTWMLTHSLLPPRETASVSVARAQKI